MKQCLSFTITIQEDPTGTVTVSSNYQSGSDDYPGVAVESKSASSPLSTEEEAMTVSDFFTARKTAVLTAAGLTVM